MWMAVFLFNSLPFVFQARNLEQKREWTLQIKRVILENYNAVIPSHARQLVLQLGQTQQEGKSDSCNLKFISLKIVTKVTHRSLRIDDVLADKSSAKKYSAPPEYLEKRKQERDRRRSETGFRQKFKKGARKSDTAIEVRSDENIKDFLQCKP